MFGGNSEALWKMSIGSLESACPLKISCPRKLSFATWWEPGNIFSKWACENSPEVCACDMLAIKHLKVVTSFYPARQEE